MLIRERLPLSHDDVPHSPSWVARAQEYANDMLANINGFWRDPLHVQLPRSDARMNRALSILLAIMLYVGLLAVLAWHVVDHAAAGLDQSLAARVTYEILPDSDHPQDRKALEARAAQLIADLRKTPGVVKAGALDQDKMQDLLAPWLGEDAKINELPLPILVDVTLDSANPPLRSTLNDLIAKSPDISLDDHARFQNELLRLIGTLRTMGVAILGLAFLAILLTSYFAAQATFHMNREVIELLHLIGAEDRAIAQHMGLTVLRQALIATCIALVLAFLTLMALWLGTGLLTITFLPNFHISFAGWMLLTLYWVIMLGLSLFLCLLAVRLTVLRALRKLF